MESKFDDVKDAVFTYILESYRHETTHGKIIAALGGIYEIPLINKALSSLVKDGEIFEEPNNASPDYSGSFWA